MQGYSSSFKFVNDASRYYHWSTAGAGCILCFLLMLLASPILALVVVVLTIGFYKYMEFKAYVLLWC